MASSLKFELFFIYLFLPLFILIFQSKILIFTLLYLVFIFTFLKLKKDKSFKSEVLTKKLIGESLLFVFWCFLFSVIYMFYIMIQLFFLVFQKIIFCCGL